MTLTPAQRALLTPHLTHFLTTRQPPKTFCPSEVARALSSAELESCGVQGWRDVMPLVRELVAELREEGECEVLQRGTVLEGELGGGLEEVVGPVRVRRTEG
jgi:hypothetical protein